MSAPRLCACGCSESIVDRGPRAKYVNDTHAACHRKRMQREREEGQTENCNSRLKYLEHYGKRGEVGVFEWEVERKACAAAQLVLDARAARQEQHLALLTALRGGRAALDLLSEVRREVGVSWWTPGSKIVYTGRAIELRGDDGVVFASSNEEGMEISPSLRRAAMRAVPRERAHHHRHHHARRRFGLERLAA